MVRLLLELGADARIVCNRDVSPLMMTDEAAVRLLLKAPNTMGVGNLKGWTMV
jgi:hypothetical protein